MKTSNNNWQNRIRQQFLLTFFDAGDYYQEKEVNGFFLIKQFNSRYVVWEVAIYTKEAYLKRKTHKDRVSDLLKPRGNKQERG